MFAKSTTCIRLHAEQIFSVNLLYTYFSILGVAFAVLFLYCFQKFQLLVTTKIWTKILLYLWALFMYFYIWENLAFMHQINSNTARTIFLDKFKKATRNYWTNFARNNYSIPPFKLNKSKYRISIRGLTLGKNIPIDTEKKQQ